MYKSFSTLNELFDYIKEDKYWTGAEATVHNRYPIRFILFENFADFNEFIVNRPSGIFKIAIDDLVDADYPDVFPTYTILSSDIRRYVKGLPANDFVLFPFSEMARFYSENEFQSLVKTIKAYQPPHDAQFDHMRLYIPIVGMQGKMGKFMDDHQTFVWEYKSSRESSTYNLIITDGTTYGVSGLERDYTVVHNLREWLKLWEKGENIRKNIICTSKNIFANSGNAQPDNAFEYVECKNAHDFLVKGLGLDFGGIENKEADAHQWEKLASLIDVETFDFQSFVNERFDTFNLKNSNDFIKTWFDCETDFDRWLLAIYYQKISDGKGYISGVLANCQNLSTSELFSTIATQIFDSPLTDDNINERRAALREAVKHNVQITEAAERQVYAKLSAMACGVPETRYTATKLMTTLTDSDRRLVIELLAKGVLTMSDVERIYPDLYHYLRPLGIQLPSCNHWVADYLDAYRASKVANNNEKVKPLLLEKNASPATFQHWTDNFKTVKTQLINRPDIEVYYWIDGLGIDWIPFISHVVRKHSIENVYLNEVFIARAMLPTTTSVNRPKLEELIPEGTELKKIGDLDAFAHQYKTSYSQAIVDELRKVEEAINQVLSQYNGKKIAFVSDHGISYLAQYGEGLNLGSITQDHEGRCAVKNGGSVVADNKYLVLDDGKTVCSLTHDSLGAKTPKTHGAHGGAMPEEVLVPIIIVSSQQNSNTYTANILNNEVDGTNPVVRFTIKGLTTIDTPVLEYNNSTYDIHRESGDTFVSDKLHLVDTATTLTLSIGNFKKSFQIKISTGAEEDDLFGDL